MAISKKTTKRPASKTGKKKPVKVAFGGKGQKKERKRRG
jgi:hypothetical protein